MVNSVEFSAPSVKDGELEEFEFSGSGKTLLAFFPGAFTGPCTDEMNKLQEELEEIRSLGAEVIGISVDTPFSLEEFAQQNDLDFRLVSDHSKHIIDRYNVSIDFDDIGFQGVAERSVFLVEDGRVTYSESVETGEMPDIDAVKAALA